MIIKGNIPVIIWSVALRTLWDALQNDVIPPGTVLQVLDLVIKLLMRPVIMLYLC